MGHLLVVEGEKFRVSFKELPRTGLKVGDTVNFLGILPAGDGAWNGLLVMSIWRKNKPIHESASNDQILPR